MKGVDIGYRTFKRFIENNLLSENNYGIYALYAIGEIVLVMVGILLALQIDNWNEARKNRSIEEQYMERLLHDLQNDAINFESQVFLCERAVSHLDSFLIEMYKAAESPDDVERIIQHNSFQTDNLTLINSTYRELISTGCMNIYPEEIVGFIENPDGPIGELQNSLKYYKINSFSVSGIYELNDDEKAKFLNDEGPIIIDDAVEIKVSFVADIASKSDTTNFKTVNGDDYGHLHHIKDFGWIIIEGPNLR